jgi:hypothetical protein
MNMRSPADSNNPALDVNFWAPIAKENVSVFAQRAELRSFLKINIDARSIASIDCDIFESERRYPRNSQ